MGSGSLITYAPVALRKSLQRFQPDLVHLEEEPWSIAALELALICRGLGIPFSFFTWENADRRLLLPFRLIRRLVLKRAASGTAGNQEAKRLLQRHGFTKSIGVVPQLGVDMTAFRSAAPSVERTGFVVGYIGRLVPQKGLMILLEVLSRLPQDVRLVLVGRGPLKDTIMEKARELSLDGRLEIHEGVAHHEVPRYLQRMSVLVLPSLTTPKWREQFGHVLVEAMACGIPVIGSDSGAIPEVIGDAGLVVPGRNADALLDALQKLMFTPALRSDLAARGHARVVSEYSNDAIAGSLASFWRTMVPHA
jgi:glycosyltransferase involved in cell wall biosynthesis